MLDVELMVMIRVGIIISTAAAAAAVIVAVTVNVVNDDAVNAKRYCRRRVLTIREHAHYVRAATTFSKNKNKKRVNNKIELNIFLTFEPPTHTQSLSQIWQ